jgi:beta-galactosidase
MRGMLRSVWAVAIAAALSTPACVQATVPMMHDDPFAIDLDRGWRFQQSDTVTGAEDPNFDDSAWSTVDVPHTWNRIGNQGMTRSPESNNVQGVGWYRLRFDTPPPGRPSPHYFLQFDAVGNVADVWLNGHYLGKHAGAFSRFRFDATAALKPKGQNILVVKADNSRPSPGSSTAAVIPLSGDFFVFGGIYRNVSLLITDPVHVDLMDCGGPGVYAHATSITPGEAVVQVTARLVNDGPKPEKVTVEVQIQDSIGSVVAKASSTPELTSKVTEQAFTLHVPHPRLWQGMKDPYLYTTVLMIHSRPYALSEEAKQPLGLRTVAFDPDRGFSLNGEHVLLHGASMHQDRPVKGWAISHADIEQDLGYLLDMGGNAVRLAHYQHDQAYYDIADQKGIVVWAEIPLVNHVSFDGTPASTALAANATQQLLELIHQNYNHPSIAVWSVANEVDLRATQSKGPSQPLSLLESLNKLAKSEDPTRFTTMADCCEVGLPPHRRADQGSNTAPAAARDQIVGITDVVGYNRYFGWYDGKFSDFGAFLDEAHARHPKLPLSISEYGAGAALTQHSEDPMATPINSHGRPHPEEYQELYHEASWAELQARPYLWGVFIWNMFDFASDSRKEGDSTDINDKGMVSYDRTVAKDAFYFYRANWNPQPTLHLVGRRFVERQQAVVDVKAYSNATQAHLRVNDHDLGAATCTGGICLWHGVQLSKGTNNVRATATIGGSEVTDSLRWTLQ